MDHELPRPPQLYETFFGPGVFGPLARLLIDAAELRPGHRVLDVACGTGVVARYAARVVGNAGRVVAVDLNPGMLAVARQAAEAEGLAIEWVLGDAVDLDLPGEQFGLIFCQQGLQFFSDRSAALRGMRSLLAPGGRLALAVWQNVEQQSLFHDFVDIEAKHLGPLGVDYAELVAPFALGSSDELRELVSAAGFGNVKVTARTVDARFPSPATFTRNMETAYAAVIPEFAADSGAFEDFLRRVEEDTREIVARYTVGDEVRFPLQTNLVLATNS